MSELLDPAFIRELEALRRRLEIRARSGAAGEHVAKRRGGSAEFQDHRPYAPGDDLRRLDWAAFARTGEPVLKLFRTEEDVVLRVLLDTSLSLDHGEPNKFFVARRLAAAVGYMVLAGSQRAQVFAIGEGVKAVSKGARGRGGLATFLKSLDGLEPAGGTDLARAVDGVLQRSNRPGMLVVISDFMDGGPVTGALGRARSAGNDLALVHVLAPDEVEPSHEGDWTLEDAETGATVEVTMDPAALEAYMLRFTGLCEELRAFARRHGATYVRMSRSSRWSAGSWGDRSIEVGCQSRPISPVAGDGCGTCACKVELQRLHVGLGMPKVGLQGLGGLGGLAWPAKMPDASIAGRGGGAEGPLAGAACRALTFPGARTTRPAQHPRVDERSPLHRNQLAMATMTRTRRGVRHNS
ncbi:MAG: DUF58 domain-containing protein, partial [Polyangiaceae bacterium]|nr:DUF58 domain-containing protein [Polyangiaceae bacterium]